ncbi:MAG: NifU N-terminal domain-containing protein [Candidatus Bathyarchaeota archaeon]|nr:NifU N-terminal domain-containing protein [Candidatus Bathyarchaeota archaeon]
MKKVLLVLTLLLVPTFALAEEVPEGYLWNTAKGAMRDSDNVNVKVFDTYRGYELTSKHGAAIEWGRIEIGKQHRGILTPLGADLRLRLLDIVADVFTSYRFIMLRKYPLDSWNDLMPRVREAIEKQPTTQKGE